MPSPPATSGPSTIDDVAVRLCRAVREARGGELDWIGIDCLDEFLAIDDPRLIDAALAFASAKGWLSIGGRPAQRVLLTATAP